MLGLPNTKYNDLLDRISSLTRDQINNDIFIKRLKFDVEKVKNADIATYHMLMGIFYAVLRQPEDCIRHHEISINLDSRPETVVNYGISLKKLGLPQKALDVLERFDVFDNTLDYMVLMAECCHQLGLYSKTMEWISRCKKLNYEITDTQKYLFSFAAQCYQKAIRDQLDENAISGKCQLAYSIFDSSELDNIDSSMLEDEEGDSISYVITLRADLDKVIDYNVIFAEKIAERDDLLSVTPHISVRFTQSIN